MKIPFWRSAFQSRRALRDLSRITASLASIAVSLDRLAEKLAPIIIETSEADLKQTSTSFSRDHEQAKILQFEDQTYKNLGRSPTEEEIVAYLDGTGA